MRDYGTGSWDGGNDGCDHLRPAAHGYEPFETSTLGPKGDGVSSENSAHSDSVKRQQFRDVCGKCGARRIDHQLGLEPTPEEYVANMVAVFREVRRVLRRDGTCWLNIGDSYTSIGRSGRKESPGVGATQEMGRVEREVVWAPRDEGDPDAHFRWSLPGGQKPKDLVGIPWRLAFALQADGWYLRSDIIWSKPNPMPESVTDRPTKAHEYLFLLTRSPRYFYNADAIREPAEWARWGDQTNGKHEGSGSAAGWIQSKSKAELQRPQARRAMELFEQAGLTEEHARAIRAVGITDTGKAMVTQNGTGRSDPRLIALAQEAKDVLGGYYREFLVPNGRNKRSVWEIATEPFSGNALGYGTAYKASPDCPKHGLHVVPERWRRAARGEPQDSSSYRIDSNDARLALEHRDESASNSSRSPMLPASTSERTSGSTDASRTRDPSTSGDSQGDGESATGRTTRTESSHVPQPGSSGWPRRVDSLTASVHNTGSHRTGDQSNAGDTGAVGTPGRTEYSALLHDSPALDGSGSHGSSETHVGTSRTCTCTPIVHDHFATFPQALVEPCVLAGTSERGCCPECGAQWERETEISGGVDRNKPLKPKHQLASDAGVFHEGQESSGLSRAGWRKDPPRINSAVGWRPTCDHSHTPVPCTVADIFMGSGTTALVARRLGRRTIGIELSAEYAALAATRLQQLSLLAGGAA